MSNAQVNSPNWGWEQLGYTIERAGPTNGLRTIRDTEGNIVLKNPTYETEWEWLNARGVIQREEVAA